MRILCVSLLVSTLLVLFVGPRGHESGDTAPTGDTVSGVANATQPPVDASIGSLDNRLAGLPLAFVENRGQWQCEAAFVARARDLTAYVESRALVLRVDQPDTSRGHVLRLEFEGAPSGETPEGQRRLPGLSHFLRGQDRKDWVRDVPSFAAVRCGEVFEGVDLVVREHRSKARHLEYDLELAPGVPAERIAVRCVGGNAPITVSEAGELQLPTSVGPLIQERPRAWEQLPDGSLRAVACSFRVLDAERYGFAVEGRDPTRPLLIDPGLMWSTYFGGSLNEAICDLDVEPSGAATFVGDTQSMDLPVTAGAFDTSFGFHMFGGPTVFVSRLDPTGSALVFSTFLEGTVQENARSVLVAPGGDTLVGGFAASNDFPTTAAAFAPSMTGLGDAFLTRLTADGRDLVFSTFLGGADAAIEAVRGIGLTPEGDILAVLRVDSEDFPTTPGAFMTQAPSTFSMPVVIRMDSLGTRLIYSTYIGGSGSSFPRDLAVGPNGEAVVVGGSTSADHPVTPGAYSDAFPGGYVTCVSPDGSSLVFSTALGGVNVGDTVRAAAFGPGGDLYVAGSTFSFDFPTTPGAYLETLPVGFGSHGFIARFDPLGRVLKASTLLGGVRTDDPFVIVVDSAGSPTVAGGTSSLNFPVTAGAHDLVFGDAGVDQGNDVFVSKLSPDLTRLEYSTYIGGDMRDALNVGGRVGMGRAADGSVVVGTTTFGGTFPITEGAFQPVLASPGIVDLAITRLDLQPAGATRYGRSTPGCSGPLVASVTAMPAAGAKTSVTCLDAPHGGHGFLLLSAGGLAAPVLVAGLELWIDSSRLVAVRLVHADDLGFSEWPVRVPQASGTTAFLQYVWPDECAPGGWSASNAVAIEIQ